MLHNRKLKLWRRAWEIYKKYAYINTWKIPHSVWCMEHILIWDNSFRFGMWLILCCQKIRLERPETVFPIKCCGLRILLGKQQLERKFKYTRTAWKVSKYGVFLVRIFPYSVQNMDQKNSVFRQFLNSGENYECLKIFQVYV